MSSPPVRLERVDLRNALHAAALLQLLDHYACDPMGGGKPLTDTVRAQLIPALAKRADFFGMLAHAHARPVGLVNCFEGFSTFSARPLLNIHDLVVHAELRGQGIGRQLLQAVEDEARARGCCKLTLEVLSLNRAALTSYERFGFGAYQLDPAAGHALFLEKKLA